MHMGVVVGPVLNSASCALYAIRQLAAGAAIAPFTGEFCGIADYASPDPGSLANAQWLTLPSLQFPETPADLVIQGAGGQQLTFATGLRVLQNYQSWLVTLRVVQAGEAIVFSQPQGGYSEGRKRKRGCTANLGPPRLLSSRADQAAPGPDGSV